MCEEQVKLADEKTLWEGVCIVEVVCSPLSTSSYFHISIARCTKYLAAVYNIYCTEDLWMTPRSSSKEVNLTVSPSVLRVSRSCQQLTIIKSILFQTAWLFIIFSKINSFLKVWVESCNIFMPLASQELQHNQNKPERKQNRLVLSQDAAGITCCTAPSTTGAHISLRG